MYGLPSTRPQGLVGFHLECGASSAFEEGRRRPQKGDPDRRRGRLWRREGGGAAARGRPQQAGDQGLGVVSAPVRRPRWRSPWAVGRNGPSRNRC